MIHRYANNPSSTITGALTVGATSLSVASATGFPTQGKFTILVDSEIMLVTGVSGLTWTVTRGHESTTAAIHAIGATVAQVLTVDSLLNANHFDVRAYGATGDGTTDDLAAFNLATAAAKAAGYGTIFVPDGTYLLSDSWNIDVDIIHVELAAGAAIFTDGATTDGHTLAFIGGGTVLGEATTPQNTWASIHGGKVYNLNNGTLDNAIGFVRYSNAKCLGVRISECGRKAITPQFGVDNVEVAGNDIGVTGIDSISVETACDVVRVVGNRVGSSGTRGIVVLGGATDDVTNVIVEGNSVYVDGHGIWVANVTRSKIVHNFVDAGGRGIEVANGDAADIVGNTITQSGEEPIRLDDVATSVRVDGNTILSITGTANTYSAIHMDGCLARPLVNNNYIASTTHQYVINAVNQAGVAGAYMGNLAEAGDTGSYGGTAPALAANLIGGAVSNVGL